MYPPWHVTWDDWHVRDSMYPPPHMTYDSMYPPPHMTYDSMFGSAAVGAADFLNECKWYVRKP